MATSIRSLSYSAVRPHVVVTEDGRLAEKSVKNPKTLDELLTTSDDIDEIFHTHLPAFIDAHPGGPVPLVIWAHGGLVNKEAGVGYAQSTADWWRRNGAYPVFMVWQSGGMSAIADAVTGRRPVGARGITDVTDRVIEAAVRGIGGVGVWDDMKLDAAACSTPESRTAGKSYDGGGAWQFARALAAFMKANPGAITVHAVGHSAGSIFHSHFVPAAIELGVPEFESVSFLAPAVRIDTFASQLLPLADAQGAARKVKELSIFTMTDEFERKDNVKWAYRKSLLYLVSNAFEPEREARILGMETYLRRHDRLAAYLRGNAERLVLSKTERDPRSSSLSTTHGGFDNDPETMDSVARRITGTNAIIEFETVGASRTIEPAPEPLPEPLPLPVPVVPRKRGLCIGVDAYPGGDALRGAVADARAWADVLTSRDFEVTLLLDADATRDNIVQSMVSLVGSATPGDVIAIQFSGHGTFVDDLDGDEQDEHGPYDEAWCPVDFRQGRLLVDDDLAPIWDLIPDGVSVTLFLDCCHSGSASRAVTTPPTTDSLARWVDMPAEAMERYRELRGAPVAEPWQTAARERVVAVEPGRARNTTKARPAIIRREVTISACMPEEVAWENNGHGVFTRTALEVLSGGTSYTNRSFVDAVVAALGDQRQQTPMLTADEPLADTTLLTVGVPDRTISALVGGMPGGTSQTGKDAAPSRNAAMAAFLRATADLLEAD
ncbi:caspase family protein [Microbacterium sp. C7(2022)]|uniref:caspase family protein n=1 Tax=Microbacterium sp. C7(2022) TaxID=2992759 RepID=UPI00237B6EDC|nr:caspase family protein [Microbacterium sp. C7(2022)]MDE0545295.1 caspase family protein [Microbacterium sp. C7(2022)]